VSLTEREQPLSGPMAVQLSKLLFEARELIDMLGDIVEGRTGQTDTWSHRVRDEIDEFRQSQGWAPDGFGGET